MSERAIALTGGDAACHDEGTLLGAFSYEMERVAHDPKLDGERPGRRR